MPDMSGADFHAALLERAPVLAGRAGFMTGGPFTAKARAFVEQMADRVIVKPFERSRVVQLVQQLRGATDESPPPPGSTPEPAGTTGRP
jgi:hypothetical protein